MAVHRRAYRPYLGPVTGQRFRFLVVSRYALAELLGSRPLVGFLILCLVPLLAEVVGVYVANNDAARLLFGFADDPAEPRFEIGAQFFRHALVVQGILAFFLAAWVGPLLVSPDLVNGALPLYLSRPFSRAEYVLGKAGALAALLSLITWVPGLILFGVQAGLAQPGWLAEHSGVAFALVAGAAIWIAVLTLLGLALSAWIRWRIVATATLFAVFFLGTAVGEMWRGLLHNAWGRLVNLQYLIVLIWRDLFSEGRRRTLASQLFDDDSVPDLPTWAAVLALLAVCAACLWLLDRRLRAREVVR